MAEQQAIGVVGVGWVGLVTAACFAELGHPVIARDILPEKVEALGRGEVEIHEPGLDELVRKNEGRLRFTTDIDELLAGARLLFVCVDTPPTYSGDADLGHVMAVVDELRDDESHTLVMKSTVPVGTGRKIQRELAGTRYVSCPEFLREGSAVADFMGPDRVVIGADPGHEEAGDEVEAIYEPLDAPLVRTDVSSAEMVKLASNTFLATKISFINEIANVCEEVGADVAEVTRGMGLDSRIGPRFLQAGVGWGGSCLDGGETVLVRRAGGAELIRLDALFSELGGDRDPDDDPADVLHPDGLEVLSWRDGEQGASFLPVEAVTRRFYVDDLFEITTKMGRRLRCTSDHPFVVSDGEGGRTAVKLAEELTERDWLPIAQFCDEEGAPAGDLQLLAGARSASVRPEEVIVRPLVGAGKALTERSAAQRNRLLEHPRGSRVRLYDVVRCGAMRLSEMRDLGLEEEGASMSTVTNGTYVPLELTADERFWRIVGLYIAEGHRRVDGKGGCRHRLYWSFHPTDEMDLVDEVAGFWRGLGVKTTVRRAETSMAVSISSRLLSEWWVRSLGLGTNCYTQVIPDLIWTAPDAHKRALIAGMWLGDGSWSLVGGGPSVKLNYGTASRALADGLLRLLGDLGLMAELRVARTAKSTTDNFWITIAGADQVERVLDFVSPTDHDRIRRSIARQSKRIAPTGYRRFSSNTAWVRIRRLAKRPFSGHVYSLEVPGSETFVATGGLVVHNCFGKDVSALKQLAANTGYHFQLLNAVLEVNELQKRRVIGKLKRHLGPLIGKRVTLLGLSFKPDTDDMRDAASLVLAARLEGEGMTVAAYDPVAEARAKELLPGVELRETALAALRDADAAVLVTEWPEFAQLDWAKAAGQMNRPIMIDGRNFLDPEVLSAAGFTYEGIGRDGPVGPKA